MSTTASIESLDVSENLTMQRRMWRLQPITRWLMLLVVILTMLGFFGGAGPYNSRTAANSTVSVDYDHSIRRIADAALTIQLNGLSGSSTQLLVDQKYMSNFQVQHITPEPNQVAGNGSVLTYTFNVPPGAHQLSIDFSLRTNPLVVGSINGQIGPDRDHFVTIRQFVYP